MKLAEILDHDEMAKRLDVLNKNKPKSTKTLIKLMKAKAKKRGAKPTKKTTQTDVYMNNDGLTGYSHKNTFDQNTWR